MTIRDKLLLIIILTAFICGWSLGSTESSADAVSPYLRLFALVVSVVILLYPFRFRKAWLKLKYIYAFKIRYQMHCWAMQEANKEPVEYGYWKSHYIVGETPGHEYTLWRVLTGYQGWKFWKWAMFNMPAVGRFSRFLVAWIREEWRQRKVKVTAK